MPTPEESARYILTVFQDHGSVTAGTGVMQQHFNIPFAQTGWNQAAWAEGMKYAIDNGWIVQGPNNFFLLTPKGCGEI